MSTPIEQAASLTVGSVESVSPSDIRVVLDTNAPQATALNTGIPIGFPRINSYLLLPNESGAVVGLITWVGVERSTFPKRTGLKDYGLIDLPFPLRKLTLIPIGTLVVTAAPTKKDRRYRLDRGVSAFPSVGDPAVLPNSHQLRGIIEPYMDEDRRVKIGISPLAASVDITVDPNKLFGRHLAVLGNTGGGKSCSVAGLIRWSLDAARHAQGSKSESQPPSARFILLDPNGEYSKAFSDIKGVNVFRVPPVSDNDKPFTLPAWMWNSHEWCAFTEAKSGVQRPILMRALRDIRATTAYGKHREGSELTAFVLLRSFHRSILMDKATGTPAYMEKQGRGEFGQKLDAMAASMLHLSTEPSFDSLKEKIEKYASYIKGIADGKRHSFKSDDGQTIEYFKSFDIRDVENVIRATDKIIELLPCESTEIGVNEDSPIPFDLQSFCKEIEVLATEQRQLQNVESLLLRVQMLLADKRLAPVVNPEGGADLQLEKWLASYFGDKKSAQGQVSIIDLSLVPPDVLHVVISVYARLIFEAIQRYRKHHGKELPTVLVLEEAHTFVQRGAEGQAESPSPTQLCRQTFERIAREGRKFGLGLVLSSQRPSEISATVIAQCNTFLLHRIVNDRDQELVAKLMPDNISGLLSELPSLPSRKAILAGWASPIPTLVEISHLPQQHRPHSGDPLFWEVWTGASERSLDITHIVSDWQGRPPNAPEDSASPPARDEESGEPEADEV